MQQLSLAGASLVLTLLIWLWADQLVTESAQLDVVVTVSAQSNSDMIVEAAEDAPKVVVVTVTGRQAAVAELRERGGLAVPLVVKDADIAGKQLGRVAFPLRDAIQSAGAAFAGCVVKRVEPSTIPIIIDRIIDAEVPIVVRPGNLDYAVEPQVEPDRAMIRIRRTTYDRIESLSPRIVLDAETYLQTHPDGQPIELPGLPLKPMLETGNGPESVERITPQTVVLRATLRSRRKEATIKAVPIKYLVSRVIWQRFDIEYANPNPAETLSVRVVGPEDAINRLTSGERRLFAVIRLTTPDAAAGRDLQFVQPEFTLPAGVTLAEGQNFANLDAFQLRLVPRAAPDAASRDLSPAPPR